ncbi:MAG: polysaccharide biosynthesis protein [Gammaproteobacteria bacterium]|nr:polysaccharide biosynthesis protein [Gammaproteobacteria bacterium]
MINKFLRNIHEQVRYLQSRWLVLLHDVLMIPIAWLSAYWLRYNMGLVPEVFLKQAIVLLPIVIAIHTGAFIFFGVHRGVWRFISIPDLVRLVKAAVIGTLVVAMTIFLQTRLQFVPRSIFVLHGLLLILLLGAPRLLYRFAKDRHLSSEREKKVLVVGAGSAGELLVRDLLRNSPRVFDPIAFVDDDPSKHGKEIHGIRVIGDCNSIAGFKQELPVDLALIAVPSASARQMQCIVELCEQARIPFRTLPKLHDLMTGQVSIRELREVQLDDLLGRAPVSLDWQRISEDLNGKRILVTGGGGSIGSELSRQLSGLDPECLILFERSEFNLYSIELELRRSFPDLNLECCLGDVCDEIALDNLFAQHRPDFVFHAAAYKHVPLLETQARETMRNNVLGTNRVAKAAQRHNCETFVLISTDKAVNPSSIMGATKRIAEILCQTGNFASPTRFVTVRFGNVLGSAGSVVPFFRQQIERGGPVTVTHPDVTRYFMTTAEACQLILQASVLGSGGEIYVLDMGDPIKVSYLAEQMIRLSGKIPSEDIDIVYSGLRPGEKMTEELFYSDEVLTDTAHEKILLAQSRHVEPSLISSIISQIEYACDAYDEEKLRKLMRTLVPELEEIEPQHIGEHSPTHGVIKAG